MLKSLKFISTLFLCGILGSCQESVQETETQEEKSKPLNVLFILVDDLGYNDLAFMGSKFYETPNIDALAGKGMIFTQGYANCQVCSPSRASLLTGQSPIHHGITDYIGAKTGEEWRSKNKKTPLLPASYVQHLPHEQTTMPEAFKAAGYKTFFAGKWHLGSKEENSLPTDHGFDINKGGYHAGGPYSGGFFSPFNNPSMEDYPEEKGMSLSMKLAKETASFIEANKDSSFFAYLSFYAVHAPIQTTKEKWTKYRNKAEAMGLDEQGFEMERILPCRKHQDNPVYAGLIEQVDEAVGHVISKLQALGLEENTIIVFTSDNGGVVSGDNYSTNLAPLRGGKGYQWEGGIRVPLFILAPGTATGKNETPVAGSDLYPTLLDLAGLDLLPEQHKDVVSLKPVLDGETLPERPLYWHYPHYGNQGGEPSSIVRQGKWKLIHYWEDGRDELYNVENEIEERSDVAASEPEVTQKLSAKLADWLAQNNVLYPTPDSLYDEVAFQKKLKKYKEKVMPKQEEKRAAMLQADWQPNEDWWGSQLATEE